MTFSHSATLLVIIHLLSHSDSREMILSWCKEDLTIIAKRIQQYMFDQIPDIQIDAPWRLFWLKRCRVSLKEVDWSIVAETICEGRIPESLTRFTILEIDDSQ